MKFHLRATLVEKRTCRRVAKRLPLYLDGELDEVTRVTIAEHLTTCSACGLELETYTRVKAVLARGAVVDAAEDGATLERLRRFAEGLSRPDGSGSAPG